MLQRVCCYRCLAKPLSHWGETAWNPSQRHKDRGEKERRSMVSCAQSWGMDMTLRSYFWRGAGLDFAPPVPLTQGLFSVEEKHTPSPPPLSTHQTIHLHHRWLSVQLNFQRAVSNYGCLSVTFPPVKLRIHVDYDSKHNWVTIWNKKL